jgi:hypothetical protein
MTTDLASTWADRELPILRAALRRVDAGEEWPDLQELRAEVGLSAPLMRAGLKALEGAWPPYIEVRTVKGSPDEVEGHIHGVSERTRRELGTWPSAESLVDRLVEALEQAADAEEEPQKKGKLRAAGEALAGFARDVAVGVVSAQVGG